MLCGDQLVSDCAVSCLRFTNNNINGDFSEAISCSLMMTELSKHVGVF